MIAQTVTTESVSAESVVYGRGLVCITLEGFHAWLFRIMIGMYGKAEATEKFWWHWHIKEDPNCNNGEAEGATYNDNKEYTTKK